MRSSKNRSRSKGNRNRSVGNVVNRVFDSSGPEGKVRGTPQQIIDKYNQLARDAQLSNDRVAAENFQQHAEHYLRMLAEAQREQDARQPQQGQQGRERGDGDERDGYGDGGQQPQVQPQQDRGPDRSQERQPERADRQPDRAERQPERTERQPERAERQPERPAEKPVRSDFDAVLDGGSAGDSTLVETPESAPKPKRSRTRRPRKAEDAGQNGEPPSDTPQEAAE